MTEIQDWLRALETIPLDQNWLLRQVVQEVNDTEFKSLRHGERHTRNKGCKGPLCQKALRDWWRDRTRQMAAATGRTTRSYRRSTLYVAIDPTLDAIKLAHDKLYDFTQKATPEELQTAGVVTGRMTGRAA